MNRIYRLVTRRGKCVVCAENTRSCNGGGVSNVKKAALTVALLGALGCSTALAAVTIDGNNNLSFEGKGESHTFTSDTTLTTIKNTNNGNIDGTTADNELTIDMSNKNLTVTSVVAVANNYYPSGLTIQNANKVSIAQLNPAGKASSFNLKNVKNATIEKLQVWTGKPISYSFSFDNSTANLNNFTFNGQNTGTVTFEKFDLLNKSNVFLNAEEGQEINFGTTTISDASKLTFNNFQNVHLGKLNTYGIDNELTFSDSGNIKSDILYMHSGSTSNNSSLNLALSGDSSLKLGQFIVSIGGESDFVFDASAATTSSVFETGSFRVDVGTGGTSNFKFIGNSGQTFMISDTSSSVESTNFGLVLRDGTHNFVIDTATLDIKRLNKSDTDGTIGNLVAQGGGRLSITGDVTDNTKKHKFSGQIAAIGDGSKITLTDFWGINFADSPVEFIVQDGGSIVLANTTKIGETDRALLTLNGNKLSELDISGRVDTTPNPDIVIAHSSTNKFKLTDSFSTHTVGNIDLTGADIDIDANRKNLVVLDAIDQGINHSASNFSISNFNIFSVNVFNVAGIAAATDLDDESKLTISNGAETFINSLNFNGPDTAVAFKDVDRIQLNFVNANVNGSNLEIDSDTKESELHLGEVSENLSLNFGGTSAKKLSVYATNTKLTSLISEGDLDISGASGLQRLDIQTIELGNASFTDLTSLNVDNWEIASESVINLDLGNELSGGQATFENNIGSGKVTWNLSSKASDLSVAEGFSTIKFGDNNAGANSTIALGQGGWLAVGNQPGLEETSTALKAFAQNGNAKTSILSFSNGVAPLQVGTIKSDGPLMVLAKSDELNNPSALVTGSATDKPKLELGSDVGFYLVSNFADIDAADAKVLVTKDYGNWSQYNGQEVGADNIFTKWEVVVENGNLSYQLKEVKTVTETLPNIIPSNGFGEILGNKNDRGGFDQGTGIGLISPEPAKIPSVGSILVGSIMDYGASDTSLISDLANTFASFATSGGVQAGAMGMSSMVSQSLDRHYSYTTTVGVNPLDTHVAGAGDLWVDALYRHDQTRGLSNGAGEYGNKTNLRGIVLGQDITLDNAWTVGAVVNYIDGQTDSDKSTIDITNKSKSYGVSAWAGYACPGNFSLKTTASYARGDNDLTANMPWEMSESFKNIYSTAWNALTDAEKAGFPENIDTGIKASMDTETVTLSARVEHLIQTPYVDIIPHVAVQYDRVKSDNYTMKIGGVGAIDTKVETMNTFSVPVGVAFAKSQTDAKTGWNSRVMADVYATPRFGDTEATVRSNFHGYNAVDKGKVEVIDDVSYGASVGAQVFKKNFAVGFNAGLEGSGKGTSASANVNAVWRF